MPDTIDGISIFTDGYYQSSGVLPDAELMTFGLFTETTGVAIQLAKFTAYILGAKKLKDEWAFGY